MKIKIIEISPKFGDKPGTLKAIYYESEPEAGSVYQIERYETGSDKQRMLFHPLCKIYFDSFCCPYVGIKHWGDVKNHVKKYLGSGYDRYEYSDENHNIITVKPKKGEKIQDLLPEYVLLDFLNGNKNRVKGFLKSTTNYGKREYAAMTDSLIREMIHNGVLHSKMNNKFNDILNEIGFTE